MIKSHYRKANRSKLIGYGFWILLLAIILPAWTLEYLPLVDLPLHAARADILHRYSSDPFLRQTYDLVIEPIPNIGTDLLMMWMRSIFSVGLTIKLMVTMIIVLYATGARKIFQIFQPDAHWLTLLGPLLAYHTMFLFGFFNYCLGLGLFFWSFSFWYNRSLRKFAFVDWLCFALLAAASYFTHLSSYAMLGVAIGTVLIFDLAKGTGMLRARFVLATAALLPLIFFFLFIRGSGTNSGTSFSDIKGKMTTLLMMVTTYDHRFDLMLITGLVVIVLLAILVAKQRSFNQLALLLTASFTVCFALCPATLFTSNLADARLVPVLFVFLLCAARLELSLALRRGLVAAVLLMLVVRSAYIAFEWAHMSERMQALQSVANILPARVTVRTLEYYEDVVLDKRERPFRHALAFKMIDRDAVISDFIGLPGQQPIVFKQQPDPTLLEKRLPLSAAGLDTLTRGYEYACAYKLLPQDDSLLRSRYELVAHSGDLKMYRL